MPEHKLRMYQAGMRAAESGRPPEPPAEIDADPELWAAWTDGYCDAEMLSTL